MSEQIDSLNQTFGIPDALMFELGESDLPKISVDTELATAELYLHGGHVTHFQPKGEEPVLFVSQDAVFEDGKAIRGGIPVIWPWFGAHPSDEDKYSHGFARRISWHMRDTKQLEDGTVVVSMGLLENGVRNHPLFPFEYLVTLRVSIGRELEVELRVRNMGDRPFTFTAALHSYFLVGDITRTTIIGLEERKYLDQLDDMREKIQLEPLTIGWEIDRIYLKTNHTVYVHDSSRLSRIIKVEKRGSYSTVVWNPWIEKGKRMADFKDSEYRNMICVETANVDRDAVTLASRETHTLATVIGVERV